MSTVALEPEPTTRRRSATLWLDLAERIIILAFYIGLAFRLVDSLSGDSGLIRVMLLVSEGMVIFFVLIRRTTDQVSRRPWEWIVAMVASTASLAVLPGGESLGWPAVAAVLLMMGIIFQVWAKLMLGRSFGMVPANRGVKSRGPYRYIRHPMYFGYMLTHIGFLATNFSWWNVAVYLIGDSLQIVRILAEERLLIADEKYQSYREAVRYRLIPGVF